MGVKIKHVSLWKRLIAFLVDLMILDMSLFSFQWYFNKFIPDTNSYDILFNSIQNNYLSIIVGISFYWIIGIFYFSTFEYLLSKTPGKALFQLKIESPDRKYLRYIGRSLQVFLIIPFWFFDILFVFSNKRQRLLELLTKTKVVFDQDSKTN